MMKLILAITLLALPAVALFQTQKRSSIEQEILKTEREQREAYLKGDIPTTEKLVAEGLCKLSRTA